MSDEPVEKQTPPTDESPAESADADASSDGSSEKPAEPVQIRFDTTEGEIVLDLWKDLAPRHTENFAQLVHEGFYDGQMFHRVIPGYLIQSGCPNGDGTGGPG